jgi:hypothetical protein
MAHATPWTARKRRCWNSEEETLLEQETNFGPGARSPMADSKDGGSKKEPSGMENDVGADEERERLERLY